MRKFLFFISGAICLTLGVFPVAYALKHSSDRLVLLLAILNFLGWFGVALYIQLEERVTAAIDKVLSRLNLQSNSIDIESQLRHLLREYGRFNRTSFAFWEKRQLTDEKALGDHLRKIINTGLRELKAQAIELALFDRATGLYSQVLLAGYPKTLRGQAMLVEAASDLDEDASVKTESVNFAGTNFGMLSVEFQRDRVISDADLQVIKLLALQGGILLADARFTNELLRMRRIGDESLKAKTGFLANLSHEIRGPLGIVLNATEVMINGLTGELNEDQKSTLEMVRKNSEHLLDLVNDVLDYAKAESGTITPQAVSMEVRGLLDDLALVVRSQAVAKGHKLEVLEAEANLAVICDKRHIRQMLINFLTNAIKYTPNGGSITLSAERSPGNRVKIAVKDSGVGIAEKEKHKVFAAFERVDNAYSNQQQGTGLGMPLTKSLAEVNKGMVGFESEEGRGSTFYLILPAEDLASKDQTTQTMLAVESDQVASLRQGNGETILLADADVDEAKLLQQYLGKNGYTVLTAKTPPEVIKLLRESSFKLAVIEGDLASGAQDLVGVLRSNPKTSTLPIILLSSKAFVFDIERFLKQGVDRCLSKPVRLEELVVTARKLLDGSQVADL
ncbi:response regulator [bacterium]|nr:response regulator [bacterium]